MAGGNPKVLLIWYFFIALIHPLLLVFCIVIHLLDVFPNLGTDVSKTTYYFDCAWILLFGLLFWQKKAGFKYERWIKRNHGPQK